MSGTIIYRWANAPTGLRGRFGKDRRDFIAHVPKGRRLGPKHWVSRLDDPIEKKRRDGSTLIAGNELEAADA